MTTHAFKVEAYSHPAGDQLDQTIVTQIHWVATDDPVEALYKVAESIKEDGFFIGQDEKRNATMLPIASIRAIYAELAK